MKKIVAFTLLLCMAFALAACGEVEITMQEIYDAARTEALLKNHESVHIREEMDGELFNERYLTKEYAYNYIPGVDAESDWAEFMTDDACYSYGGGNCVFYLPIAPEGVSDYVSYRAERYASVLSAEIVDETIESVSEKDGRITVTSVLSEKTLEILAEEGVKSGKFEYVLDAKTRETISLKSDSTYTDGSAFKMMTEVAYDTEAPEKVKTFLGYVNQTENLRTVTVVSNPGTAEEKTEQIQAPKGLIFGLRYEGDTAYEFEVYADAACTEGYDPYVGTDSDLTVFVKWTKA